MTKRRRLTDDDLRADPDYQELCRILSRQAPEKKARTEAWLSQQCDDSQEGGENMRADKAALDARIIHLRDNERLSWPNVATQLQAEGFSTMTEGGVRQRYQRGKKAQLSQASQVTPQAVGSSQVPQPCEPEDEATTRRQSSQASQDSHLPQVPQSCEAETPQPDLCETGETRETTRTKKSLDETCESSDTATGETCEPSQDAIPATWFAPLRNLINQEIRSVLANTANLEKHDAPLPPATPRIPGTKRYVGKRRTLPGTVVDQVLFDRFEEERRNLAISASEMMQRLLWQAFGRPRLSFQEPEDE